MLNETNVLTSKFQKLKVKEEKGVRKPNWIRGLVDFYLLVLDYCHYILLMNSGVCIYFPRHVFTLPKRAGYKTAEEPRIKNALKGILFQINPKLHKSSF